MSLQSVGAKLPSAAELGQKYEIVNYCMNAAAGIDSCGEERAQPSYSVDGARLLPGAADATASTIDLAAVEYAAASDASATVATRRGADEAQGDTAAESGTLVSTPISRAGWSGYELAYTVAGQSRSRVSVAVSNGTVVFAMRLDGGSTEDGVIAAETERWLQRMLG